MSVFVEEYSQGDSDPRGRLVRSTTLPLSSDEATARSIEAKIAAALRTNATFLALSSPSNAQIAAQVKALTRQVNAIVRKLSSDFSSDADS